MTSPFVAAAQAVQTVSARAKVILFGAASSGISRIALSAPGKIALISTDTGAARMAGTGVSDFDLVVTRDWAEFEAAVDFLANGGHAGYETIVVDNLGTLWAGFWRGFAAKKGKERPSTNDWGVIKPKYRAVIGKLVELPTNLVLVAGEARESKDGAPTDNYHPNCEGKTLEDVRTVLRVVSPNAAHVAFDQYGLFEGRAMFAFQKPGDLFDRLIPRVELASAEQLEKLRGLAAEIGVDEEKLTQMAGSPLESASAEVVAGLISRAEAKKASLDNGDMV